MWFLFIPFQILLKSGAEAGFALMVESGRIDHAHHGVMATRALSETVTLDAAIEHTVNVLAEKGLLEDTLIIVTADHAHTMSISGYPQRGEDIRGNVKFLV